MAELTLLTKSFSTKSMGTVDYKLVAVYSISQTDTSYSITVRLKLMAKAQLRSGDLQLLAMTYPASVFYVGLTTSSRQSVTLGSKFGSIPAGSYIEFYSTGNITYTTAKSNNARTLRFWLTDGSELRGESYSDGDAFLVSGTATPSSSTDPLSATLTVPAKTSYVVSYNGNGGTAGVPASQTKYHGESLTLATGVPSRAGYVFTKWNTAANGSGTSYSPGATYTGNAALTLYAQWSPVVTINSLSVTRVDDYGDPDPMGERLKCSVGWTIDSSTSGNNITASCNGVTGVTSISGNSGTTNVTVDVGARPDTSYSVSVKVLAANGASATSTATSTASSTGYTPPVLGSVESTRTDSQGTLDDEGQWAMVSFPWSVAAIGSQTEPASIEVRILDGDIVVESHTQTSFSGSSGTYSHIFGGQSGAFLRDAQYLVQAVLSDKVNSVSKGDILSTAFFTMDVKDGGHGVSFGAPAKNDVFNVSMPVTAYQEQCYPTFIRSSWSTSSDESTLPVTPCFVLSTSDGGLYWCDGN